MKRIEIDLDMIPPTKTFQDKGISIRNGKAHVYQRKESADIREAMRSRLIKFIPEHLITDPIQAEIIFYYPPTKKVKSILEHNHLLLYPKATKPDCDNLSKQLLDIMQELGFYKNDSQIYVLMIEKFYVAEMIRPKIKIILSGD